MKNVCHARVRQQQRCLPPLILELLEQFGTEVPTADGAVRLIFDRKSRRNLESYCGRHFVRQNDRYFRAFMVIDRWGKPITVGWRDRSVRAR